MSPSILWGTWWHCFLLLSPLPLISLFQSIWPVVCWNQSIWTLSLMGSSSVWLCPIHCLILSIHCWRLLMVCSSAVLSLALKESLMLWSSANPLIFKLGWTTSSKGAQYRLKMLAPAHLSLYLLPSVCHGVKPKQLHQMAGTTNSSFGGHVIQWCCFWVIPENYWGFQGYSPFHVLYIQSYTTLFEDLISTFYFNFSFAQPNKQPYYLGLLDIQD